VGFACATKLTAWPLGLVLGVMTLVRHGPSAVGRFGLAALATLIALLMPAVLNEPRGLVLHQLAFPVGLAWVRSPAGSPSIGRVLSESFTSGHWIALGLLAVAGVSFCCSLLARPPADECAAALWSAAGLAVAALLLPASRVGYIVYSVALVLFALQTVPTPGRPDRVR
jgi:hypothetical protein